MILVIAEKPALAKDIADAIGGTVKKIGNDYYEARDYVVTWLFGHILTLKDPEDYDAKFSKRYDLSLLPIYFENWQMKPGESKDNSKKARLQLIGKLLKTAESVIHAGDPDEEGQLLVDEVLRWHHYKGKVSRLDTSNTTKEALQKALLHMKDNVFSEPAGWSAYARSVADFIVGINLTRYFSAKNKMHLPFGRVKIPTLGLVIQRDYAIEKHKETVYYEIVGNINCERNLIKGKYVPLKTDSHLVDGRILSEPYAESKREMMRGFSGEGIVTKSNSSVAPPLPFNLVKLQSYCSTQFGYTPSETLEITQNLRTVYHAITYNRSDCQYLSEEHFKEAPKTVAATLSNLGVSYKKLDTSIKSKCFNDANLTAHFAIIPSGERIDISKLSKKELNVYRAICKYYLIQFMPHAKKEKTLLSIKMPDGAAVEASSIAVKEEGYLELLHGDSTIESDDTSDLSKLSEGKYHVEIPQATVEKKTTKPPARYTKASLNEDMTRIAKYVDSETVRKLLLEKDKEKKGENGSIGTPATRAAIIDELVTLDYVRMNGKYLISTEKGREYYRILPDEFKKADMTAYWWVIQEDIKNGKKVPSALAESVLKSVVKVLHTEYPLIKGVASGASSNPSTGTATPIGTCPACGGMIIETQKAYGCANYKNGCGFAIWKKPAGSLFKNITITPTQARQLMQGKSITTKKLYSEKKDKNFEGEISMQYDPEYKYGARLNVQFGKNVLGLCPVCGSDVVDIGKGYGCTGYGKGCKFVIWKVQFKGTPNEVKVSPSMAKKLLAKGLQIMTKEPQKTKKK